MVKTSQTYNLLLRPLFCALVLTLSGFSIADATRKERAVEPKAFIETVLSPSKTVGGVSTLYSVVVYSNVPDILRVEVAEDPGFGSLKVSKVRFGRGTDNYVGEKKRDSETWYGYVVDSFILTPESKGNYKIEGGAYNVCVGVEGVTDDWFWGPRRTTVPHWIEADAPDSKLSVSKRPASLSGHSEVATGEFTAEWEIPAGDIVENSRALAIFHVKGKGILPESSAPDFESISGNGIEIVYSKPEVKTRLSGTDIISEMEVVVEFIPHKKGKTTIPEVEFVYLDPDTGKIKTIKAKKTEITVKSGEISPSSKARIYEI